MTEKPHKPLSLKPKADTPTPAENTAPPIKRRRKRIIWRDELPTGKLTKTRPPLKPKPKQRPKLVPSKQRVPPSDIRLDNLNASLNAFEVWRTFQPVALGIDKAIFRHIAKHNLSASKRVVKRLLHQHTRHQQYLQNIRTGTARYHFDDTPAGTITQIEREHSTRMLSGN